MKESRKYLACRELKPVSGLPVINDFSTNDNILLVRPFRWFVVRRSIPSSSGEQ